MHNDMKTAYGLAFRVLRDRLVKEDPLNLDFLGLLDARDVVVVPGTYDHISNVLECLEIPFLKVDPHDLQSHFESEDVDPRGTCVFVNCSCGFPPAQARYLADNFVSRGGLLLTTDWALSNVIEAGFPGTIRKGPKESHDDVVGVIPVEGCTDEVTQCFGGEESAPVWWLETSSYMVEIVDPEVVEVLVYSDEMQSKYGSPIVLCKFRWGDGLVYHMTSHAFIQRVSSSNPEDRNPDFFSAYLVKKGASPMTAEEIVKAHGNDFKKVQSCLTALELVTRLILKQKRLQFGRFREDMSMFLDAETMQALELEGAELEMAVDADSELRNPCNLSELKMQCINMVSASLINEPKFFNTADENRQMIAEALCAVVHHGDPEFLLKLATHVRQVLNIRSTANFILAVATSQCACHPYLQKYFMASTRLPSDLVEVCELYQLLPESIFSPGMSRRVPAALRKAIGQKFSTFSEFQLAKYNKKARRPKPASTSKATNRFMSPACGDVDGESMVRAPMTLQALVRICHVTCPSSLTVMKLLEKRYPTSEEEFVKCKLPGEFDPEAAGQRLKLDVPETWETMASAHGNDASVWEYLMEENKLPFMAMLRNLRNMMETGVSATCHAQVLDKLRNPKAVQQGRLMPTQFLSAYKAVDISEATLQAWRSNKEKYPDADAKKIRKLRKEAARKMKVVPKRRRASRAKPEISAVGKLVIPKEIPTPELIAEYRGALNVAVGHSARFNLSEIPGSVTLLLDISGSMLAPCSTFKSVGTSSNRLLDAGAMLACMIAQSCSGSCDFRVFGSPSEAGGRCDAPVPELQGGHHLLDNVRSVVNFASEFPPACKGTDFPFTMMREKIEARERVDYLIVVTDAALTMETRVALRNALDELRLVDGNECMTFVLIDLHGGSSSRPLRPTVSNDAREIFLSGFSDALLRYIPVSGPGSLAEVEGIEQRLDSFR